MQGQTAEKGGDPRGYRLAALSDLPPDDLRALGCFFLERARAAADVATRACALAGNADAHAAELSELQATIHAATTLFDSRSDEASIKILEAHVAATECATRWSAAALSVSRSAGDALARAEAFVRQAYVSAHEGPSIDLFRQAIATGLYRRERTAPVSFISTRGETPV